MKEIKICVIGLGYVGLPLARLFSTKYKTVGFDMNPARVAALMAGHDATSKCPTNCCRARYATTALCVHPIWRRYAAAISTWWPCPLLWMRTTIPT